MGSDPHGFDGDNDGIGCETGNNQPDVGEEEEDDGGDAADNDGGDGADEDGGDADEGEGGGEGNNSNEFEGCIVPPGRDPSDAGCPDTCESADFFIADRHVMKSIRSTYD